MKSNCVDFLEKLNFIGDIKKDFCIFLCRKYHLATPYLDTIKMTLLMKRDEGANAYPWKMEIKPKSCKNCQLPISHIQADH